MARLPRLSVPGVPQHIIQRGNNRRACFGSEQDIVAYANWLKEGAGKFGVAIHAWVFMTNHVHLLATPAEESSISRMMQYLGRHYVLYFNHRYKCTGTLWEGRYKSCLVQDEGYLLECYRYIELNPVRAGMVEDPADFPWSSYGTNALGRPSSLCTPHALYLALGKSTHQRLNAYRNLFKVHFDTERLTMIRKITHSGLALGNDRFKDEIEVLTNRRVRCKKAGRPRKVVVRGCGEA